MEWLAAYIVIALLWVPAKLWVVFTIPLVQLIDESQTGGVYYVAKILSQRTVPRVAVLPFSILCPLYILGATLLGIVCVLLKGSIILLSKIAPFYHES